MFGENPSLSPLESHKQRLLAASEFNRERLVEDLIALTAGVRTLTDRAKSCGAIASSVAVLVAGLAAFGYSKSAPTDANPSWLRKILKGAGMVSTLWLSLRSRSREN